MSASTVSRFQPANVVDRTAPLPVYFQIAADIRRRLDGGEWSAGDRIAAELELAREYEVSRMTIRQALAELVKDDLLERRRGSGTYVRQQRRPLVYDLSLTVGALASRWQEADFDNRAEVIEATVVEAPEELRHRLQLPRSRQALYLMRRVFINGQPTVLYRSWFDARLVPGLERSPRLQGSLSRALADDYDLVPVRAESELEVVRSTREETQLLQAASDIPIAMVTSTTYLGDGRPLEHAQLAWLGDRVRFHITAYGG
ncbi:MAG: GntR family transcriptional regulator [Gaiellaceae bacterium]